MDEKIAELKEQHPTFTIEKEERTYIISEDGKDGEEQTSIYYNVAGLPGNEDVTLALRETEDFDRFNQFLETSPTLLNELIGCSIGKETHVLLSPVSRRLSPMYSRRDGMPPIHIRSHYYGNSLEINIAPQNEDELFPFLISRARQIRRRWRSPIVAVIKGLDQPTEAGLEADVRSILSSMLFDVEFTYGLGFETVSFETIQYPRLRHRRRHPELPKETFNVVYKDYIPELLEYYHAGEKVDYLPFKYVCYFHVIEYFSDKSAYHVVSRAIRAMMLRPDFHESIDSYVNRSIQLIKKESERNITDKIKVNRVLRQFTSQEEIQAFLVDTNFEDYFSKECTMDCAKPLILPALDFSSENKLFDSLTRRIYSLRCAIVHSNPDFEDSKAIPFVPNPANLDLLRTEIELVSEIARGIIVKSARN
jgi:hypothetical protein